ncbi:MAG: hypothetical protein JO072_09000 [Parafilimonas sp.]|nr:hypothetical protein [Parafilimonas sp.]
MFVVIESFNESIFLILDENGKTFITEDLDEATKVAQECQNGIIIELPRNEYSIL